MAWYSYMYYSGSQSAQLVLNLNLRISKQKNDQVDITINNLGLNPKSSQDKLAYLLSMISKVKICSRGMIQMHLI